MAKKRNGKVKDDQVHVPIAKNEDMHYTDPFDEDDWEAQERMKAADIRAQKNS
jgi:hypothetical protein